MRRDVDAGPLVVLHRTHDRLDLGGGDLSAEEAVLVHIPRIVSMGL